MNQAIESQLIRETGREQNFGKTAKWKRWVLDSWGAGAMTYRNPLGANRSAARRRLHRANETSIPRSRRASATGISWPRWP